MKKCYLESISTEISYIKYENGRIGHILRRNCLLKQVIEGKIKGEMEVTRRRGKRHKKLLDDLRDGRGYFHLKEKALDLIISYILFHKTLSATLREGRSRKVLEN
jgi:hypothetical protein